jgi:hypothetical protein
MSKGKKRTKISKCTRADIEAVQRMMQNKEILEPSNRMLIRYLVHRLIERGFTPATNSEIPADVEFAVIARAMLADPKISGFFKALVGQTK